jgi:hypothetical protein
MVDRVTFSSALMQESREPPKLTFRSERRANDQRHAVGTGETTASHGCQSRPSWLGVSVASGSGEAALTSPHKFTAS